MKQPKPCISNNPCRNCSDPLECNKSCEKLEEFLGSLEVSSFGVLDTSDDIGYNLLTS